MKRKAKKRAKKQTKVKVQACEPMTAVEYVERIKRLGREPHKAATMLGISVRQSQRFAAGDQPVPIPVSILLRVADENKINADTLERLR